jgi:diguanylate cyclase (GGDEF)-like protein
MSRSPGTAGSVLPAAGENAETPSPLPPACTSGGCPAPVDAAGPRLVVRPGARLYLGLVIAGAALATASALAHVPPVAVDRWSIAPVLGAVAAAAWLFPLRFGPKTRLQLDTAVVLAAVLLLPSGIAALVVAAGPLVANLRQREPWLQAGFNASQSALQALAGGALAAWLGWQVDAPRFAWPDPLLVALVVGVAMHAVNTGAVAGIVALQSRQPFPRTWRMLALGLDRAEVLAHLAQLGFGILAAAVVSTAAWLLGLLLLPAVAVYVALGHNARLRWRAEERVVHQAFHDALTDLPNRGLLVERLQAALERWDGNEESLAVLFVDLDRFKLINDTLGHQAGDALLVAVAERLRVSVRAGDTVARLGGDEFIVLLEGLTPDCRAETVAARITRALAAPLDLGGRRIAVTTSVGIAFPAGGRRDAGDLLRAADVALYQAKDRGRAQYAVYDQAAARAAEERLALEGDLRRAIERRELRLVYQPRFGLMTGKVDAIEALVRWFHPERGEVAPTTFLAIAVETGLIVPLGRWVLAEACRQAREWQRLSPKEAPVISVNVAARQLQEPDLVGDVARVLAETGLAAGRLQLEVAETVATAEMEAPLATLRQLRRLGVRVAVDDFGTGHASLQLLSRFPVDTLQLDRSFVTQLGQSPRATTIAQAVIALAHGLGLTVVAEGIETDAQLDQLRGWGCDYGQGIHLSPPLPSEGVIALLTERPVSVPGTTAAGDARGAMARGERARHARPIRSLAGRAIGQSSPVA